MPDTDWTPPATPKLLSGDNPQVPKGVGEAPIRYFIDTAPGWKGRTAGDLDALITARVPGVRKAVKWNTPLYGLDGDTWFLGFHCMKSYIKVTFFSGADLDPVPPEPSTQAKPRSLHLREGDPVDTDQLAAWIEQAAALPGERM